MRCEVELPEVQQSERLCGRPARACEECQARVCYEHGDFYGTEWLCPDCGKEKGRAADLHEIIENDFNTALNKLGYAVLQDYMNHNQHGILEERKR